MGNNRIMTKNRTGLTVAQVGGNDIYKMLPQIRSIIEMKGLDSEYASFFAEPAENNGTIDWYADEDGTVVPFASLTGEEQQNTLERFQVMVSTLKAYAAELKEKSAYRTYGDILEKALLVPDSESFFLVNGKPVVTCWGFSSCDTSIAQSCEIETIISRLIEKKRPEPPVEKAPVQPEKPQAPAPQPAQPEEKAEPVEPQPEEKAAPVQPQPEEKAPSPVQPQPPVAPAQPKKSPMVTIAGILLLLLLAAVAAWFFLNRPGPDMSFLKDRIEVVGVLADENDRHVTLRMDFPDRSGAGMSYIEEEAQTCQGDVRATLDGNNVLFQLDELICPNKNNYDPFQITCVRGSKNCTGTNKKGGTWAVEIEIER